jgi:hypothetical protein
VKERLLAEVHESLGSIAERDGAYFVALQERLASITWNNQFSAEWKWACRRSAKRISCLAAAAMVFALTTISEFTTPT